MTTPQAPVVYTNNYLTHVILRVDFPSIENFGVSSLKELQKAIKSDFPILQERKTPLFNLNLSPEQEFQTKLGEVLIWTFSNKEGSQKISIENNNFTMEFTQYSSFTEFFSKIKLFIDGLFSAFPELISTRVGLRYINEIKLDEKDPLDWSRYVNDDLIKLLEFFKENSLTRYITSIEMTDKDSNMVFKFGIPNSLYPNKIIRKEFVLDYDCFTANTLEKEEILKTIETFHNKVKDFFEKSIKNELRKKMVA